MREISPTSPAATFTPTPRRGVNVSEFLRQTARRMPERPAVIDTDNGLAWTWKDLDDRADALALELQRCGVGRRDTVVLASANHGEVVQAFWGILRSGAVIAPPNAALPTSELVAIAADLHPAALIIDRGHQEFADALLAEGFTGAVLHIGELPSEPVEQALAGGTPGLGDFDVEEDDPCWYFFTSGSTGRPKAATFTHRHLGAVLSNHRADLFPDEDDTGASLVVAPLSHGAGIHMLAQVFGGTPTVINPGGRVDPGTLWRSIDRFGITNAFTVPTILNRIVTGYPSQRGPEDHTLNRIIYAGAPMLAADQRRALDRLGPCLVQYFGLAEVTGAITVLRADEHGRIPVDSAGVGTCGRARTGVEILILDDEGLRLPAGASGEVCVAGPTVCAGYLGRADANQEAFAFGVFHTGDVGYLDEAGYLFLTGRKSDMYISGGSNVYPREIEELLLTDDAVSQAVVVGVPDDTWGEIGIAVIELVAADTRLAAEPEMAADGRTSDDPAGAVAARQRLHALLKSKLANYKVPKEIRFVDRIPVTAYGKLARKELRTELSLGRGSAR